MHIVPAHHHALPHVRLFPRTRRATRKQEHLLRPYAPRHARSRARWKPAAAVTAIAAVLATGPSAVLMIPPGQVTDAQGTIVLTSAALPARVQVYYVRRGDTLSSIAARFCGSAGRYPGLAAASGIRDANRIYPGERVILACRARGGTRTRPVAITVTRGMYSYYGLEALWRAAGGPAWAAPRAARIALCESGGRSWARNPSSGAAGLWQILGLPFPGNPYNPYTNARMAVAKFRAAGDSFSPWVCKG